MPTTLYDKIWNDHLVDLQDDGTALLFVDRHLVHEVTSPQAFEGLRNSKRKVRHPELTLAVADHNVPTTDRSKGIADEESKIQVDTLEANCKEFGVQLFGMDDKRQGIVHIIGPEQGFTQPGTVIVCGDSHTSTHGAFGSLAFGIGTSEVEHVLATQTLVQKKAKNFRINVNGKLPIGVTSKDVILQIIGKIGTAGGTGCVIEYAGDLITSLSVEQRMTICNMTIEGGARAGLIAPDQKIFDYFDKPLFLAQTWQLHAEPGIFALEKIFTIQPSFRAEKSKTSRHLTEYWHAEMEVAWEDFEYLQDDGEEAVKDVIREVLKKNKEELKILERDVKKLEPAIKKKFPRITYDEALEILATKKKMKVAWGKDFRTIEEDKLSELYDTPVFVTHYPKEVKAFYMKEAEGKETSKKGKTVFGFDLIAPEGYGEIIGGSQREESIEKLKRSGELFEPRQNFLSRI